MNWGTAGWVYRKALGTWNPPSLAITLKEFLLGLEPRRVICNIVPTGAWVEQYDTDRDTGKFCEELGCCI